VTSTKCALNLYLTWCRYFWNMCAQTVLAKVKQHHKVSYEHMSKALKIDEDTLGIWYYICIVFAN